jgi:hypothetical protein
VTCRSQIQCPVKALGELNKVTAFTALQGADDKLGQFLDQGNSLS